MKHTPGPWHVVEGRFNKSTLEVFVGDRSVCELWRRGNAETELANARLIAAAPEMLGILQIIVLMRAVGYTPDQYMSTTNQMIRDVIAKATGENYAKAMGECADEDGDVMCSACNCWKATRANCS